MRKVTVSARQILGGTGGLIVLALLLLPWFLSTNDGSWLGTTGSHGGYCVVGVARGAELMLGAAFGAIGLMVAVGLLWKCNPKLTFGGEPEIPSARVVKR